MFDGQGVAGRIAGRHRNLMDPAGELSAEQNAESVAEGEELQARVDPGRHENGKADADDQGDAEQKDQDLGPVRQSHQQMAP